MQNQDLKAMEELKERFPEIYKQFGASDLNFRQFRQKFYREWQRCQIKDTSVKGINQWIQKHAMIMTKHYRVTKWGRLMPR